MRVDLRACLKVLCDGLRLRTRITLSHYMIQHVRLYSATLKTQQTHYEVFVDQSLPLVSYLPVRVYGSAKLHHGPRGTLLSQTTVALNLRVFYRLATLTKALANSHANYVARVADCQRSTVIGLELSPLQRVFI